MTSIIVYDGGKEGMFGRIKVQTWLILGILHGYVAIPLLLFSCRGCSSHLFATVLWIFVFQFFIHIAGTRVLCQKVVSCVAAYFIVALLHFFVQCLMISFSLVVVLMVEGFCSSKDDVWSSAIVTCRTVSAWL